MKLQKYVAMHGIASRRKAEELIAQGLVKVNGEIVREMGVRIDPEKDRVMFRGKELSRQESKVTILFHKPVKVVSSVTDPFERTTVVDLVRVPERIYPVGRLDYMTSGLLVLTNDGDLTQRMTHPRYGTEKRYMAWIQGNVSNEKIKQFQKGMLIDGYVTKPADVKVTGREHGRVRLEVSLREGRNRQIRKMCEMLEWHVVELKRVAVGFLELGDLEPGQWRYLNDEEIKRLKGVSHD